MQITAAEFKAGCLQLMDQVARAREPLVVTKHGKPVAMMVPVPPQSSVPLFGYMAGTASLRGDIVAPTGAQWQADSKT